MSFYTQPEAQALINQWGTDDRPFLFVISYDRQHCFVRHLDEISPDELLFAFPSAQNTPETIVPRNVPFTWRTFPETPEAYRQKFDIVKRNLMAGNSFLTNLTCRIPVETSLSLREIFLRSEALYKLWMRDRFVCFSPEIFLTIKNGAISSYPMKGTIDASLPDARQRLLEDAKEAAEHATIVDLIRNDLSIVAEQVHVPRYRYVDVLHTNKGDLLETSSEVTGQLPSDYRQHLGDILFAQLPAGSITGAPKVKTQSIIAEAEDYDRGFYTGVMGICQKGNMESAVMIRFVEADEGQLYFKAGGGITYRSQWQDEYNEVIQKAYVPIY